MACGFCNKVRNTVTIASKVIRRAPQKLFPARIKMSPINSKQKEPIEPVVIRPKRRPF